MHIRPMPDMTSAEAANTLGCGHLNGLTLSNTGCIQEDVFIKSCVPKTAGNTVE
jgi:hypothetical protein